MTGHDIIDEVRSTLLDTVATYRWADTLMLGWLNDGMAALFAKRPDCVILDTDETISCEKPVALVDLDETITLEDRWRPALVHYVLWRAYDTETDSHEEGARGRALGYKARFDEDANPRR
jgi:hypothetical protein